MVRPMTFMYSGQGSQYYQMGAELYQQNPRFKVWMDHCSEICYPLLDCDLTDILYQSGQMQEPFETLRYTNPSLIAIQYSLSRVLMEQGIEPAQTLGYSLGELVSAIVSGCLDIEDGLILSIEAAKLFEDHTPQSGMLAVLSEKSLLQASPELFKNVTVSGENCQANFVVSGLASPINTLHAALREQGISSVLLPVRYGFHTHLIDDVETQFKALAKHCFFQQAQIPLLSLSQKKPLEHISAEYLWDVFRQPVYFEDGVTQLIQRGYNKFIDLSPSATLSTFLKYIDTDSLAPNAEIYPTISQFGSNQVTLERLQNKLQAFA
ncbi:hypothetical protein A7985_22665 [Pseudoalteromonas luteoviolacea]|uniref:Malonyl-CoA:ACP transacylase (MAT) domain-containing protein n=1 Tax=Pseudoalteromonas luteoviolacea TaxID=43657 RepID=A0A1C0TJV6_9GAMM|nr:acyltransferase domain-containing protein [Pseudoalteromonas luteoviolacea]MBQ4813831.1 acyltransferase domain-containing protein [Pseudoalteromonas luteoviolacea]OCQ18822.1 hypothetical protein A7985_22665 [Pseudoalteromonas luteoviolacea]